MEVESSPFESSEMLASFLASTPLFEESWRLCRSANSAAPRSFVADQHGEIGYLAFSGVQVIDRNEPSCGTLLALDEFRCEHLFSLLECDSDSEGTVKVDAGFLRLFLEFYQRRDFQSQIRKFQQEVKVIIITGHSFGATTAALTALWLLSQPDDFPISVGCLTFGTPLLGNESLSQAILRKKWGGSFYNVVSKLDLMPRLFFSPLASLTSEMHVLVRSWQKTIASRNPKKFVGKPQNKKINRFLLQKKIDEFFNNIKDCVKGAAQSEGGAKSSLYWPLGSYLFCAEDGVFDLNNAKFVVKMMQSILEADSPASSFKDHLKYGYYIKKTFFAIPE